MSSFVIKNTLTNYLVVIVRFLQGILVTRWMIEYLGKESYGLWSLLWAFFAYTFLLDFGFGVSAQKYTSSDLYKKDINHYNRIVSAIFSFHLGMSFLILTGSAITSFFLPTLFNLTDPAKLSYARFCYFLFAIGAAIAFPTGIFPEILVGLRKLYLRNYVNTVSKLLELVGTLLLFIFGGNLAGLVLLSVGLWFFTNLTMAFLIPRHIPGFKIRFKIDVPTWKEISNFSGSVYLTSIAKLIMNKSSHLVISILCGLVPVGIYQLSSKLSDMCLLAASQYQENVRPITASLYSQQKYTDLKYFIFNSMRWNCCMGLLFILPAYLLAEEAMLFLFKVTDPEVISISRLFLIVSFCVFAVRQIPHSYLLMAEQHKLIARIVIIEAFANLGLNIALVRFFGVSAVLWDALGISLGLSLFFVLPAFLRSAGINPLRLLWKVYLLPFLLAIPGAALAVLLHRKLGHYFGNFGTLVVCGSVCSGSFVLLALGVLLNKEERRKLWGRILQLTGRQIPEDPQTPPVAPGV